MKGCQNIRRGDSLAPKDASTFHVFNEVCSRTLSLDDKITNGRLCGKDLSPSFHEYTAVVLENRGIGFAKAGAAFLLDREMLYADRRGVRSPLTELRNLLQLLPLLNGAPTPSLYLIGIEGAEERTIKQAINIALEVTGEA